MVIITRRGALAGLAGVAIASQTHTAGAITRTFAAEVIIYSSIEAGEAATTAGETFFVDNRNQTAALYRRTITGSVKTCDLSLKGLISGERNAMQRSSGDGATVQAALDGYATRAEIKALKSYDGARAFLTEQDRAGEFVFRAIDYSNAVAADPLEGVFLEADDTPATAGAWVRVFDGDIVDAAWFGALGDGVTDDIASLQAANDFAFATDHGLRLSNRTYYTTTSFEITAPLLETTVTEIIKEVDDSPVVIFQGETGGGPGKFREHRGFLRASQSAQPGASDDDAAAYLFRDVVHCKFGALWANHCSYGFVNDGSSVHGLFWGNVIDKMHVRGCTHGYMRMPTRGSGGHTENFIAAAYLNGQEIGSPALLPKTDFPIWLNNAEGWRFGTLNLEWTETAEANFIQCNAGTTLNIGAMHFEGNEVHRNTTAGIFGVAGPDTRRTNVTVGNLNMNNCVQTGNGVWALVNATATVHGSVHVGAFSGAYASNTLTDARLLSSAGIYQVRLGAGSGWEKYFTDVEAGSMPAGFPRRVFFGDDVYHGRNVVNGPGATVDIGAAKALHLTGKQSGNLTTISAVAQNAEKLRWVAIENRIPGLVITSDGNIKAPDGASLPVTVDNQRMITGIFNFQENMFYLVSW